MMNRLGCFGAGEQFNARLVPAVYYLVSAAVSIWDPSALLQCHCFRCFKVRIHRHRHHLFHRHRTWRCKGHKWWAGTARL